MLQFLTGGDWLHGLTGIVALKVAYVLIVQS